MIVTSKEGFQKYLFAQAGNIYDEFKDNFDNINKYDIEINTGISFDTATIYIGLHHKDSLEWARECIENQRECDL